MLTIKLSQTGKTNKKMFRLIISEKGRDPYGRVLENLGSYNPHTKELIAKNDRVNYWVSQGAQLTATANNLLISKNIISGEKKTASKAKKTSDKRLEQIKAKQEKKQAREAAPAEAPKAEEAPAEAEETAAEPVEKAAE